MGGFSGSGNPAGFGHCLGLAHCGRNARPPDRQTASFSMHQLQRSVALLGRESMQNIGIGPCNVRQVICEQIIAGVFLRFSDVFLSQVFMAPFLDIRCKINHCNRDYVCANTGRSKCMVIRNDSVVCKFFIVVGFLFSCAVECEQWWFRVPVWLMVDSCRNFQNQRLIIKGGGERFERVSLEV